MSARVIEVGLHVTTILYVFFVFIKTSLALPDSKADRQILIKVVVGGSVP